MLNFVVINFWILALLVTLSGAMWILKPSDLRYRDLLITGVLFEPILILGSRVLNQLPRVIRVRYDEYIFRFDAMFGQPSFYVGRLLIRCASLNIVCRNAYFLLGSVFLVLAAVLFLLRPLEEAIQFLWFAGLCYALAPLLYVLLPVSGPLYAFSRFPNAVQPFVARPIYLFAAPNGIPSVHASFALSFLHFSRHWKTGVFLALIYFVLIIISTLGMGEHYLLDLLASIPYTALIIHLGSKRSVSAYAHRMLIQSE